MAKKLDDGRWACEAPGCKYINTKEGYVRNHEKLKHGGVGTHKTGNSGNEAPGKNAAKPCPDCKGTNIRLLNTGDPEEKIAKAKGYKYICDDCEEVFK